LFARAVRYAQSIYWKGELKAEWKRRLRRPRRLFQALMKQYYRQLARKREQNEGRILRWSRNVAASRCLFQGALLSHEVVIPSLPHLLLQMKETRKTIVERGALW
jgi:hypothetical protein